MLSLIVSCTLFFAMLEYNGAPWQGDDMDMLDDFADDMEMLQPLDDHKDMVSAEAPKPAPKETLTEIVRPTDTKQVAPDKMVTTSKLVIGDGEGLAADATVTEAIPEQVADPSASEAEAPVKAEIIEQLPEFPGGISALVTWLTKNLRYPAQAKRNKIQGKVVVSFVINKDGTISNAKVERSAHKLLDAEALRVVGLMPRWKPGRDEKGICRTLFAIPVVFQL